MVFQHLAFWFRHTYTLGLDQQLLNGYDTKPLLQHEQPTPLLLQVYHPLQQIM